MEQRVTIAPAADAVARVMRVLALTPMPVLQCEDSGEQVLAAEVIELLVPLQAGDRVLVQPARQGWVITARLGGLTPPPFSLDERGCVCLSGDNGIRLQVGDARIEITRAGCITVDGKEVHTLASGLQRIMGSSVQIN